MAAILTTRHARNPITEPVNPESIYRVYSGKPGCGCGCRGTYWEDARNIRRIVKQINSRLGTGAGLQTGGDGLPFCYFVEDGRDGGPGRYWWAYVKGGSV